MKKIKSKIKNVYEKSPFLISTYSTLKKTRRAILTPFMIAGSLTPFFSSAYYTIFSRVFGRENRAVLLGHQAFAKSHKDPSRNSSQLRRNTHRLEKGLLMRPRRKLFALNYIEETINLYEKAIKSQNEVPGCIDAKELDWAAHVLTEYFEVVESQPKIDALKKRFNALQKEPPVKQYVPYKRNLQEPPTVAYDDLLKLMQRRRSVRWYLPQKVPRELVDKAITASGLSPSACNRQPFEFRVFDEPDLVRKVINLPLGTRGYKHNVPMIIAVIGKLDSFEKMWDRHLIYIDSSLAVMSLILALETLELSSCCINWQDIRSSETKMAKLLKLPAYHRPIMLLAVGYPDPEGKVAYSQKKSLDKIRKYN